MEANKVRSTLDDEAPSALDCIERPTERVREHQIDRGVL